MLMKDLESEELLGALEIWGDDDFFIRAPISDAAEPLLDYMRAHYTDPETTLQMDMTGKIFVYQPKITGGCMKEQIERFDFL